MNYELPPYRSYPILSGEHLTLREILSSDIENIIDLSFYDGQAADSLETALKIQLQIDADYQSGNSIHWGIALKKSNLIIGTCGYYRGLDKGIGELGCILKQEYRGQGYMSIALQLAIDFGLDIIGLDQIRAITSTTNIPALKLLERLHFTKTNQLDKQTLELTYQSI